jgi:hypothetical protein
LLDHKVFLVFKPWEDIRGSTVNQEVHLHNRLLLLEYVLLFLNIEWVDNCADPCDEALVFSPVCEEFDALIHLEVHDLGQL